MRGRYTDRVRVLPVPCLKDNYAYLIVCPDTGHAAIVDPGEPGPVRAAVAAAGVELVAVWATHHHADHVGGVRALLAERPGLDVVGHAGDRDRIDGLTVEVDDGDEVVLGRLRARIVHNPGHTRGAVSYVLDGSGKDDSPEEAGAVFTGDTLFGAGCGRLFEGTAAQMQRSLARLAALPPSTRVFFGHEYTAANLRFAAAVEPGSEAIAARAAAVAAAREAGRPSTPSTVADERTTNPFVRVGEPAVIAAARAREPEVDAADPAAVLAVIRAWKDRF